MKKTHQAVTIIAVILGVFFAFTGAKKLFTDWEWGKEAYLRYHPLWVYYASGLVEFLGGLGLLWRRTRFVAATAILIMIILVAAHPWRGGWVEVRPIIIPAATSTLLVAAVAWFSRPRSEVGSER